MPSSSSPSSGAAGGVTSPAPPQFEVPGVTLRLSLVKAPGTVVVVVPPIVVVVVDVVVVVVVVVVEPPPTPGQRPGCPPPAFLIRNVLASFFLMMSCWLSK